MTTPNWREYTTPGWTDPTGRFATEEEYLQYEAGETPQPSYLPQVLSKLIPKPRMRNIPGGPRERLERLQQTGQWFTAEEYAEMPERDKRDALVMETDVGERYREDPEAFARRTEAFEMAIWEPVGWTEPLKKVTGAIQKAPSLVSRIFRKGEVIPDVGLPETATDKFIRLSKKVKEAYPKTKKMRSEEMSRRVARVSAALAEGEGEEPFLRALRELKGELPFEKIPDAGFTPADTAELFTKINQSPKIKSLDKVATYENLADFIREGRPIQRKNLEHLEKVFGTAFVKELADPAKAETIRSILLLPKAFQASYDLSGSLRQGLIASVLHPGAARRANKAALKAMVSEKFALELDDIIVTSKYGAHHADVGLFIPQHGAKLSVGEEVFASRFAKTIPGMKQSERHYSAVLKKLRSDTFELYADDLIRRGWTFENNLDELSNAAHMVNLMTGRGDLGALSQAAEWLNVAFFSPRWFMSRLQLPVEMAKLAITSPAMRPIVAREFMKTISIATTSLMALKLAGADVNIDPLSSDFGKVKIGDVRMDLLGGYAQVIRYGAQFITGKRRTQAGRIMPADRMATLGRFFQSKLSPTAGAAVDIARGETFIGEELAVEKDIVWEQMWNRMAPLFVQDLREAWKTQGLEGGFIALSGGIGVGITAWPRSIWTQLKELRDYHSGETYGEAWNDLDLERRDTLRAAYKEIGEMEGKAEEESSKQQPRGEELYLFRRYQEQIFWDRYNTERENLYREQQENDRLKQAGQIGADEWRDRYSRANTQLGALSTMVQAQMELAQRTREELGEEEPEREPEDVFLAGYYAITPETYKDETLNVDWAAFFKAREDYLATLSAPDKRAIESRLDKWRTPYVQEFKAAQNKLRSYWNLKDILWDKFPQLKELNERLEMMQRSSDMQTKITAILIGRNHKGLKRLRSVTDKLKRAMRVKNPEIDALLVEFYGNQPILASFL